MNPELRPCFVLVIAPEIMVMLILKPIAARQPYIGRRTMVTRAWPNCCWPTGPMSMPRTISAKRFCASRQFGIQGKQGRGQIAAPAWRPRVNWLQATPLAPSPPLKLYQSIPNNRNAKPEGQTPRQIHGQTAQFPNSISVPVRLFYFLFWYDGDLAHSFCSLILRWLGSRVLADIRTGGLGYNFMMAYLAWLCGLTFLPVALGVWWLLKTRRAILRKTLAVGLVLFVSLSAIWLWVCMTTNEDVPDLSWTARIIDYIVGGVIGVLAFFPFGFSIGWLIGCGNDTLAHIVVQLFAFMETASFGDMSACFCMRSSNRIFGRKEPHRLTPL